MRNAALYKDDLEDAVHVCQQIFTTLMTTLASPGTIGLLEPLGLSGISRNHSFALQPLLALLDLETRHHVFARDKALKDELECYLQVNTQSVPVPPERADFILCLEPSAHAILPAMHRGTLARPDRGATLVYQVEQLENDPEPAEAEGLLLTGPGIKDEAFLAVAGLDPGESALWRDSRLDYPLGIDIFLVSRTGQVVGIPRSVAIVHTGVN